MGQKKSEKLNSSAVIVAAGSGSRMGGTVKKQYIELAGRPILAHTIDVFERCGAVDEIVLVVGAGEEDYVQTTIVEKFGFEKVSAISPGGKTRSESCYRGICRAKGSVVLVHDGARPFVRGETIAKAVEAAEVYGACAVACRSVDTIKIVDAEGFVTDTPARDSLWNVQTPQGFSRELIRSAYERMFEAGETDGITDDAMVAERFTDCRVRIVPGDPENIKITTPKDLVIAEQFMSEIVTIQRTASIRMHLDL